MSITLVSQTVEHTEIDEHLEEIADNLFYTIICFTLYLLQQIREHLGFFLTASIIKNVSIKDTRVLVDISS